MIIYDPGAGEFSIILRLHGSVFPRALKFAIPSAGVALALEILQNYEYIPARSEDVLSNSAPYTIFSGAVGFLLVFRTSQAYNRFWEGATTIHQMRSKWGDACGTLVAYSRHSKLGENKTEPFQHRLVRLFSLLHAMALKEISKMHTSTFEVIDPNGLDERRLEMLNKCPLHMKTEIIFQWILQIVTDNSDNGMLAVAPPILSRVFQELSNGMVNRNNALKIANTPIPFPYAQMTSVLLAVHWLVTPFLMAMWAGHWASAAILTFIPVLCFWCIQFIATEIEQPFGEDVNDLPVEEMQTEFNETLLMFVDPVTAIPPKLGEKAEHDIETLRDRNQSATSFFHAHSLLKMMSGKDMDVYIDAANRQISEDDRDVNIDSNPPTPMPEGSEASQSTPVADAGLNLAADNRADKQAEAKPAQLHQEIRHLSAPSTGITSALDSDADACVRRDEASLASTLIAEASAIRLSRLSQLCRLDDVLPETPMKSALLSATPQRRRITFRQSTDVQRGLCGQSQQDHDF